MKRRFRLTKSSDIKRVRQFGKTYAHPLIVLKTCQNNLEISRFCIVAGSSIGKAVQRNHAKRRLRAALDCLSKKLTNGRDVIVIARSPINQVKYHDIYSAMVTLLTIAGLINQYENR